MKHLLRQLVLALLPTFILFTSFFLTPASVHAIAVDPFPPFSEEGNPPTDYMFGPIFELLRYIPATALEIYENEDRSRQYEDFIICPGAGSDRRDYYCDSEGDGCDGGPVDICHNDPGNKSFAYVSHSGGTGCRLPKVDPENPDAVRVGKCDYRKRPTVQRDVKGTDFAYNDTLTFSKIQSESLSYSNVGTDNLITWGSSHLANNIDQSIINRALVLARAKQTKNTLAETGEWPLGWVDWGYQTANGKTLIDIHSELPGSVSGNAMVIVESVDDFFLTGGNLEIVSNVTGEKAELIKTVKDAMNQKPQPGWVVDFMQSPLYPPSFRRGYVRPSICVWDKCCPTTRCPVPEELLAGNKRGLYYDISISQAYGAAMDDLFLNHPLDESVKLFKKIVTRNPLARYLTSAAPKATPPRIKAELNEFLKGTCYDYVGWSNWLSFGTHMDYVKPGDFLDPQKKCPDYTLMPEVKKEVAAARSQSLLDVIVSLFWNDRVDDVEPYKKHYITVPDAMGQSLDDLQGPVYETNDTLEELESIADYNEDMSNIVDDGGEHLYGGKRSGPVKAKRGLAYYACDDNMFSAQTSTSIEAYAMGTRIGCYDTTEVPEGKCDGQAFAKLIEGTGYSESGAKGQQYFDTYIKARLTPELMNTYAAAEKETGVPCEILAGIHFVEADNNPEGSLVSGRPIGNPEPDAGGKVFRSLLETAVYAGEHLKGKVGGDLQDAKDAITALSRYNGGGNSNCQLGYPYPIPYGGCPRAFEGEDDPYPVSFLDPKHDTMYLLYCADHTACAPQVFQRPGSFTVALNVYNSMTKDGYENSELPPTQPPSTTPPFASATPKPPGSGGFFPQSCGPESLSTALGCVPYTRAAFASALLTFIVGIAGAVALVTMLIATFLIMTAGDKADQLKKGRELFTSAVIGLLFLIFSVSLLRIIAGDIIKLPGFGG
jgi:hypothetical protein